MVIVKCSHPSCEWKTEDRPESLAVVLAAELNNHTSVTHLSESVFKNIYLEDYNIFKNVEVEIDTKIEEETKNSNILETADRDFVEDEPVKVSLIKQGKDYICMIGEKQIILTTRSKSCPVCYKMFMNSYNMRRHIRSEHEKLIQLPCDVCDKYFSSETSLVCHRKTHCRSKDNIISKKYDTRKPCTLCDKSYNSKDFWRHLKEVHGKSKLDPTMTKISKYPFQCKSCSFMTKRKFDLQRHYEIKHMEIPPKFPCHVCSKSFGYSCSLKRHIKSHLSGTVNEDVKKVNCDMSSIIEYIVEPLE